MDHSGPGLGRIGLRILTRVSGVLAGLLVTWACGGEGRRAHEVALGDSTSASAAAPVDSAISPSPAGDPKPPAAVQPDLPPVSSLQAGVASSTLAVLDLGVQPAKGQSNDQTVRDELFCSDWATGQTGMDPLDRSAPADSASLAAFGRTMADCLKEKGYHVK
jgi:hypothetical protein